jgi:hypothetical protein
MSDQTNEVPTQRGTSAGEIGQNPVETRDKQPQRKPDGFVDSEPTETDVNDSLGTVNTADTMDTDPEEETESKDGEGI